MRFALVVLMLAVAHDADACQCMESGPPCQSFFQTKAVFAGTVRRITPVARTSMGPENVRVEFEQVIAFRGVEGSIQTVMISEAGLGSCSYPFEVGERYVVYASRGNAPGAPFFTSTCSRTRPIAEAAEDLAFFQSLSSAIGSPRVFGSVTHSEPGTMVSLPDRLSCAERNFELRFDSRIRGAVRHSTGEPAAGVRVQLIRKEYSDSNRPVATIDTNADAAGAFEFREISTGSYADGTPAIGTRVMLLGAVREWNDLAEPIDVDASGTFTFVVHEGLSYIVTAHDRMPYTRGARPITTDVGPFVVTRAPAPLQIVVARIPRAAIP